MVRLQRHVVHPGMPKRDAGAWIDTLRAEIKHIHDLRWKLAQGFEATSRDRHAVGGGRGPEDARTTVDAHRRLDELEHDVYHGLDPYLAQLKEDASECIVRQRHRSTHAYAAPELVQALVDLRRLREAKLRAIAMARHTARYGRASARLEPRPWIAVKDATLRWLFMTGLRIWVRVLRRDKH